MNTFGSHQAFYSRVCKRAQAKRIALGAACLLLWGCAIPEMLAPTTTGEKYRQVLASIDALCKKRGIGPYLDPSDPQFRTKAPLRTCEVLKVKPFDLNAVLATEEGKFAYSIKLPAPLDKPQVAYTKNMSAEDYFKALCARESGDFIFATAKDVDRLLQLRTSPPGGRYTLGSYSEESLGGHFFSAYNYAEPGIMYVGLPHRRYSLFEAPAGGDGKSTNKPAKYLQYYRDPAVMQGSPVFGVNSRPIDKPTARYAYAWRGVERENARDLGILGGELIILDLTDMRILAVRRDFARFEVNVRVTDRVDQKAKGCRLYSDLGVNFMTRILNPAPRRDLDGRA
jgi:hypothetical protein